jgi:hypothetical protein
MRSRKMAGAGNLFDVAVIRKLAFFRRDGAVTSFPDTALACVAISAASIGDECAKRKGKGAPRCLRA